MSQQVCDYPVSTRRRFDVDTTLKRRRVLTGYPSFHQVEITESQFQSSERDNTFFNWLF